MLSQVVAKNKGNWKIEMGENVEKWAENMRILGKSAKKEGQKF